MARLNYVELPVAEIGPAKAFYEAAFGWDLTDFGPTYAATLSGDTDIGLQADAAEATRAPLPVIDVENLEAALAARGPPPRIRRRNPGSRPGGGRGGGRADRQADLRLSRRPPLPLPRP